ncbi:MAG: hypothetical protein CMJ78_16595 [Planctomycetaceae bacterium]|nr:hypothetical protein [Planctomycetaceae bacterium]
MKLIPCAVETRKRLRHCSNSVLDFGVATQCNVLARVGHRNPTRERVTVTSSQRQAVSIANLISQRPRLYVGGSRVFALPGVVVQKRENP